MISNAAKRRKAQISTKKMADVTVEELDAIYEQIIRITENTMDLRAVNALIVKNAPIDEGLVRILELIEMDFHYASDVLHGLV